MKDLYTILGVDNKVTPSELRKRWRELARKYHPDHHPDDPLSEAHFKEVLDAYRVLSDPELRRKYDRGERSRSWADEQPVHHYFFARCEPKTVRCFDEIHVSFTYSGRGKVFRKPFLSDFFITGSPFVAQRMVVHEGHSVLETELTYVVCPLKTGQLVIGRADITINRTEMHTEEMQITSTPNRCYFSKGIASNGKPFKLTMHYEYLPGEEPFFISEIKKNHTVLIPRSKTAHAFHSIGSALKITCTVWVMIKLSQWFDLNILAGMAAGNLFAGINCRIMYALAGIKPKFSAPRIYPLVSEYYERGYYLGESKGIPLISGNFWYYLGRLFL